MKITMAVLVLFVLPCVAFCQNIEFPHPLEPGQRFTTPTNMDTLFWVLKSSQYDKALNNAAELENSKETTRTLELKTNSLQEIIAKKDSTISDLNEGFERYKNLWEETDRKLEDSEVRVLKLRRATFLSGILGIGAGIAIGALAF